MTQGDQQFELREDDNSQIDKRMNNRMGGNLRDIRLSQRQVGNPMAKQQVQTVPIFGMIN